MGKSFKIIGEKALRDSLKKKSESVADNIIKAVNMSTLMVHSDIVESIQRGAKSGVTYQVNGRTAQRSASGQAPATDTGHLVSNIIPKIIKGNTSISGEVTSRANYSYALEFGTKNMSKRPFMRPALKKNSKKIDKLITQAVNSGLEL